MRARHLQIALAAAAFLVSVSDPRPAHAGMNSWVGWCATALAAECEKPMTIMLRADGLTMMGTEVAMEELVPRLRAARSERASRKVYFWSGGAVPYAQVMEVLRGLLKAGVTDIRLVTNAVDLTGFDLVMSPVLCPAVCPR